MNPLGMKLQKKFKLWKGNFSMKNKFLTFTVFDFYDSDKKNL